MVLINTVASVVVLTCWIFFKFYFKGTVHHFGYAKNVFPLLEPKLLVIWERIGEVLQIVCEVLYTA